MALVALASLALSSSACIFARVMYYGEPSLSAPTYFDSRVVPAPRPSPLRATLTEAKITLAESTRVSYRSFDDLLRENRTRAFLWIHDDQIVYERYFDRVTASTQLPSFSMSKTFASVLVGAAAIDGLVGGPADHLVDYLPELAAKPGYRDITLDHLLRMTSGLDFTEESVAGATFYYSTDLRARLYDYEVTRTPGTRYLYGSLGVQLIWSALDRRLAGKTVAQYFSERVWGPIGAEHAATWSLDSAEKGVEKLFGGFAATTRDHARIGLLFLHGGEIEGSRVVSEAWTKESLALDPVAGVLRTTDGNVRRGKYQWFWTLDGRGYFAKGYRGQYVFVVPTRNMVFVRFGDDYGDVDWTGMFLRLADSVARERASK